MTLNLREKADKLAELLNEKKITRLCIGLAEKSIYNNEEKLYIWLEKKMHRSKHIPTEFMGIPVITEVVGKIQPL